MTRDRHWKLVLLSAALTGLLLAPEFAAASGSGSFFPTGSMGTSRGNAVAAPLPGGLVLVASGATDGANLNTAEIFNSQTSGFSAAGIGTMVNRREHAAAAPLPGGKVLITGGYTGSTFPLAGEVFDPATGAFTATGPMSSIRYGPIAAPLPDGRVLVAGGNNNSTTLATAEIFDPATNTFSSAGIGVMGTPRQSAAAAPLPGGRVLVAGGQNGGSILKSAEVYDPRTDAFSSAGIGSMTTARQGAAAAALPDGRVLIVGGSDSSGHAIDSAEAFDPATNSFSSAGIGSPGTGRSGPVAAPLGDGRVLVAGGFNGDYLASAEIFSATNTFSFSVKGKKLLVSVQASGKVSVNDANARLSASTAKRRRVLLLKPSSAAGDPPRITVPLFLTKTAKARLKRKGKVTVNARITFTPLGGLASTQTAKLKIKGKKRK